MRINKKHIIGILAAIFVAISIVAILAWAALKPVAYKSNFDRNFITEKLKLLSVVGKSDFLIGIAGTTESQIFCRTKDPKQLATFTWALKGANKINLEINSKSRLTPVFQTYVDSPFVKILAGNGPSIIHYDLRHNKSFAERFAPTIFSRSIPISNSSFIIRGFDTTKNESGQIFMKGNVYSDTLIKKRLPKEIARDIAGISDDGYLNYDPQNHIVTYVLYYQNKFLCYDTSLNFLYSVPMINRSDNKEVKISTAANLITNASPTQAQNGISRISNGKLYNVSKLMSRNENEDLFLKNFTIDIYDIQRGKYEGSFYIPNYMYEKPIDFFVKGNKLLVLYRSKFAIYSLTS